jgi:hypothetical protein
LINMHNVSGNTFYLAHNRVESARRNSTTVLLMNQFDEIKNMKDCKETTRESDFLLLTYYRHRCHLFTVWPHAGLSSYYRAKL